MSSSGTSMMGARKPPLEQAKPGVAERVMLWLSTSRERDGLWIGTYYDTRSAQVLDRVEAALQLIETHDRIAHGRIRRNVRRIWVRLLTIGVGEYSSALDACLLDERYVLAEETTTEAIAATIVHEVTHARLGRCGIRYDEPERQRIEAVCFRREIAFARRLPNGATIREHAERALLAPAETWSDGGLQRYADQGSVEVLEHLGRQSPFARLLRRLVVWRMRRRSGRDADPKP